jgi:hypothetical protein
MTFLCFNICSCRSVQRACFLLPLGGQITGLWMGRTFSTRGRGKFFLGRQWPLNWSRNSSPVMKPDMLLFYWNPLPVLKLNQIKPINQLITSLLVHLNIHLNVIHTLKPVYPNWPLASSVFDLYFVYTHISNLPFACCITCQSLPLYVQHSLETGCVISKEDLASVDTATTMCKAHRNIGILRFSSDIGMCMCRVRDSVSRCPTYVRSCTNYIIYSINLIMDS